MQFERENKRVFKDSKTKKNVLVKGCITNT